MAHQKGSTSSIMIGIESAFGIVATTGFILPVNPGESVVGSQSINSVETLTSSRNPAQPYRGNRDVSGQVTVPVDSVCLPYWLIAMFGDPTTTGSDPYTHEWTIPASQPSFSYEKAFTDLSTSRYARHLGCKIGGFSIQMGGDGELTITFNVTGASDSWQTSAFDAAPTSPTLSRINNFDGAIEEGGASSTVITQLSMDVNLNLDTRAELIPIGAAGIRQSLPEGKVSIDGNVTALFDDDGYAILAKGVAGTESSLKYTATQSSSSIFEIELQEVEYGRSGQGLDTPGGLLVSQPFSAFYGDGSEASAVVLRITNGVTSYDLV